ncbi:MAG: GerMN domain-containing protein [Candidatus Eremiobacteraeota bacterium]|nr:GerMN domain-containing protein [Candidatus Eremiobacteraeota bacterium]
MRALRAIVILALLIFAVFVGYRLAKRASGPTVGSTIQVYYCKLDGQTLVPWTVTLGSARDPKSVAFYAAVQAVAGPPSGTDAIRFPAGTVVRAVNVSDSTATVDLSQAVASSGGGSFAESGEFKALVWTLTALPDIHAVQIRIEGRTVPTLPGGHLELDEPLTRSSW